MQHLSPHIKRFYSHLNSAVNIITAYNGEIPFAHYIKNFFAQDKKFGSKDRKKIAELCYCYFRLGKSYAGCSEEQKIITGYRLSKNEWSEEWLDFFAMHDLPIHSPENIFSFKKCLSEGIDINAFEQSHLIQPDLFLRIRPGFEIQVRDQLQQANASFSIEKNALRLANSFKVADIIAINKEAVVQDLSSQKVGELLTIFKSQIPNLKSPVAVWDCCAASGGKSILAKDILGSISLAVSDIRISILANLKKRFAEAGISDYIAFVADATTATPQQNFDLIITDVPCSGSGTWARTPEQLSYFEESKIDNYAQLQTSIVFNAAMSLKPGGFLLYITCSVFAKENEDQLKGFQNAGLQLVEQRIICGYTEKADTMFAALLKKV